ncbi:omega-6 fatty acid desaturase (delta-12 desaturase) [Rhodovulum iodosum]|uniref:Omega-6 fatty acid desaturase (Delta-12 desaturase) n=1 Tax=Rhodovulum iodosum TaxID=68291 RepID=A0ABV3XQD1_9RHOB|nr:fatty acid desaturase [Rhodovulum robiginosum]RSK33030.1 fatty acid desaturase [Rhodovulum robiginosum]
MPEATIRAALRRYTERDDRKAALSLLTSFAVYFATLWLAVQCLGVWPLVGTLVIVNALAGVRLYVLQHDCGHGSLFAGRRWNDLAGHALSTFTLTPYAAMRYNHNLHHAHIGDLAAREAGEIHTMTLREWQAAGPLRRLGYRIYRHPLFLLPVGGLFVYVLRYRWPRNAMKAGAGGVLAHDAALAGWVGAIYLLAGWAGLAVYGATVSVAAVTGVFLVYLQHNFEDTWWDRKPEHDAARAALQGSSALDLGWWFDLATGNIAYHDIHHFNARIPGYNLRRAHRALRADYDLPVIGWPEALRSFTLKLWDEDRERLVPFPKPDRGTAAAAA